MNSSAALIMVLPMRYAVQNSIDRVREGNSLYKSLEKTGYFSPIFVHLLASGEASGELDQLLQRVADQQDREVETVLKTVLTLFEPLLILFMGAVVLFIVLAILLPIFNLIRWDSVISISRLMLGVMRITFCFSYGRLQVRSINLKNQSDLL